MSTYNNKLQGYQNNSKQVICFVEDASGDIYDITDYSGYMYAKKYPINPLASALDVSMLHTSKDIATGAFYFSITSTTLDLTPGDYSYEIIIDDSSTNRFTVVQDRFNLVNSLV